MKADMSRPTGRSLNFFLLALGLTVAVALLSLGYTLGLTAAVAR